MKRDRYQLAAQSSLSPEELQKQIELRAYQLYEERGRLDGLDLDDWLDAEAEILDARDLAA